MATTIEKPMTRTGFCQYVSPGSHVHCHERGLPCGCPCHADIAAFDDGVRIGEIFTAEEVEIEEDDAGQ